MGFTGSSPSKSQIDAVPVLQVDDGIVAESALAPIEISAAELDGASAIMFVHDSRTPTGADEARFRFDLELFATTGVVARIQQWGEIVQGSTTPMNDTWRLPVVIPVFGGVRLTISNIETATRIVTVTGYALRGADLDLQPVSRGFFDPGAPTGVPARMQIPVIPPGYRVAQIHKAATAAGEISTIRSFVGTLNPDAVGTAAWVDSARDELVLTVPDTPNYGYAEVPVAGMAALQVSMEHAELTPPPRMGFVVTFIP